MPGPDLPNTSLFSAIERLKLATTNLPLSTPEGSISGPIWRNFNISPHNIKGAIFEKIDQAYTRCFSRLPDSSADPIDNILRGPYGMDIVIRFFEEFGQLTDLVYTRIASLPSDPPTTSPRKRRRTGSDRQRKPKCRARVVGEKEGEPNSSSDSEFHPQSTPTSSDLDEHSSNSDIDQDTASHTTKRLKVQHHANERQKVRH
ncbi:hypothetical protein BN14_12296 [Rhizoctonia solani AG-1 IB]|uniref:Uncharacterized protein n=1 Tax=Thanatephorus cucumeris (strain AG1-IB / isolate 7/3/14) TaxID=1108050 RepID=M5CFA2_THACB|nr:hypothetical protein BN14_12296 [Rhizoctonia solani AG-1 IB]